MQRILEGTIISANEVVPELTLNGSYLHVFGELHKGVTTGTINTIYEEGLVKYLSMNGGSTIVYGTVIDVIGNGGSVNLEEGGLVNRLSLLKGATSVAKGAVIKDLSVTGNGATVNVYGAVEHTVVDTDSSNITVYDGGVMNNVTLTYRGYVNVKTGGILNNVHITQPSSIRLAEGSILRGNITISVGTGNSNADGITASGKVDAEGVTLTLDASNHTAGNQWWGRSMMRDLNNLVGVTTYNVTVDSTTLADNQYYWLSTGASGFNKPVTVNGVVLTGPGVSVNINGRYMHYEANTSGALILITGGLAPVLTPEYEIESFSLTHITISTKVDKFDNELSFVEAVDTYYSLRTERGITQSVELDLDILDITPMTLSNDLTVELNGHQLKTALEVNDAQVELIGGEVDGAYVSNGALVLTDVFINGNIGAQGKDLGNWKSHDTHLILNNSYVDFVYAGGYNSGGVHTSSGANKVTVNDSRTYLVYGGGNTSDGGVSSFEDSVVVVRSNKTDYIYGGSHARNNGQTFNKTTTVLVEGVTNNRFIVYAGSRSSEGGEATVGSTTTIVDPRSSITAIYGGGYSDEATYHNIITGNTNITVNGGAVGRIYGGGNAPKGGSYAVLGEGRITLNGGTYEAVYGGGYGTSTMGGTNIVINANEKLTISKFLVGGGHNGCTVTGDTNITITGVGTNLNFRGTLSCDGNMSNTVNGSRKLTFADYLGNFDAKIIRADSLSFTGETSVVFTYGSQNFSGLKEVNFTLGSTECLWTQRGGSLGVSNTTTINVMMDSDVVGNSGSRTLVEGRANWTGFTSNVQFDGHWFEVDITSSNDWTSFDTDNNGSLDLALNIQRSDMGAIILNWAKDSELMSTPTLDTQPFNRVQQTLLA